MFWPNLKSVGKGIMELCKLFIHVCRYVGIVEDICINRKLISASIKERHFIKSAKAPSGKRGSLNFLNIVKAMDQVNLILSLLGTPDDQVMQKLCSVEVKAHTNTTLNLLLAMFCSRCQNSQDSGLLS